MRFDIEHLTEYLYSDQVRLDQQTLRLTPRPATGINVISQVMEIFPEPTLRMVELDPEGNLVTKAMFEGSTSSLKILNRLSVDTNWPGSAETVDDESVLTPYLVREEPSATVDDFAHAAMEEAGGDPLKFVWEVNRQIFEEFTQVFRENGGPYSPATTLELQSGACRDFAVFMMDACRAVGIPARFVSGYQEGDIDASHRYLHAWLDVYLDALGWTGYDPTLGLRTGISHVPLAAAAVPNDTSPVTGTYWSFAARSELRCSLALSAR